MAVALSVMPVIAAYAQTPVTVLGTNGSTYNYNAGTGMYTASNGSTYNPSGGTYTADGVTYTYNPNSGLYYTNGVAYTYNPSSNAFTQANLPATPVTTGTPVFYTQGGAPIYNNGSLPAGIYYNASGQSLYYYGNGYYYNAATATYGSIYSPGFVSTTYPGSSVSITPTAPNTGFGGGTVALNWTLLAASFLVVAFGAGYLVRRGLLQAIR